MAEESAKPPTITTPVGHMRTCEHLAWQERHATAVSGRLLAERGGSAENAGIDCVMLATRGVEWWQCERITARDAGKQLWRNVWKMLANVCALMAG